MNLPTYLHTFTRRKNGESTSLEKLIRHFGFYSNDRIHWTPRRIVAHLKAEGFAIGFLGDELCVANLKTDYSDYVTWRPLVSIKGNLEAAKTWDTETHGPQKSKPANDGD